MQGLVSKLFGYKWVIIEIGWWARHIRLQPGHLKAISKADEWHFYSPALSLSLQYLSLLWAHPVLEITHFIVFCLILYLSKPYILNWGDDNWAECVRIRPTEVQRPYLLNTESIKLKWTQCSDYSLFTMISAV